MTLPHSGTNSDKDAEIRRLRSAVEAASSLVRSQDGGLADALLRLVGNNGGMTDPSPPSPAVLDPRLDHLAHLAYESAFWGDCTNTYGEEQKQYVYAQCMGLERQYMSFDVQGKRILDVGGGPVSLLLKTTNLAEGRVVDPIPFPDWTVQRYAMKNISVVVESGEELEEFGWDEVWIYNVLQHVIDPGLVLDRARRAAPVLRLFEWIDIKPYEGHPHMLTAVGLSDWLGGVHGMVQQFSGESGCYGRAFYGVFRS